MNLQDEIKLLKERIAELEEQVEEEREFPQNGDLFFFVNTFGVALEARFRGGIPDEELLEIGNVFKTREQAEFAVEKMKVEAELRKFSRGYIDGRNNWYILYDFEREKVMRTNELHHCHQGVIYFSDTYTTREAIEAVGEQRIKKYIFEVEE